MRAAWFAILWTTTAVAEPKLEPKLEPPPPPRVREIAHRLFEEAAKAAAADQLDEAVAKYHELDRLAPHPHISFNLAMVYEKRGDLVHAIEHYEKYVAAEAADTRTARHLADLRAAPGEVELEAHTKLGVKALWYLDGELAARETMTVALPSGRHRIDMISELGHDGRAEVIDPGKSRRRGNHIRMNADYRRDGNLVIASTANARQGWFYKIDGSDRDDALGKGVHRNGRYQIDPGRHAIVVRDTVCEYESSFVVGKDELVLVYFDREGFDHDALLKHMKKDAPACGKLVVKRSVVKFDVAFKPKKRIR